MTALATKDAITDPKAGNKINDDYFLRKAKSLSAEQHEMDGSDAILLAAFLGWLLARSIAGIARSFG